MNIIACIPAYNEALHIHEIIQKTSNFVNKIIVCDDGSSDNTYEILSKIPEIEIIRNETNLGKGYTMRRLLEKAKKNNPDIVIFLDGDLQHNPEEIPIFINAIVNDHADFVIGSRFIKGGNSNPPLYRRIGLAFFNMANSKNVTDSQSGFRAIKGEALDHFISTRENGYGIEYEQISIAQKANLTIVEVPISISYHGMSTSKKNPISHGLELVITILRIMIAEKPLLIIGIPGIASTFLGLYLGYLMLMMFNTEGYFSVPIAFLALALIILGITLLLSSMTMYGILLLRRDLKDQKSA
jgi:glycosyltransferase involved in cell wall biosynthesis